MARGNFKEMRQKRLLSQREAKLIKKEEDKHIQRNFSTTQDILNVHDLQNLIKMRESIPIDIVDPSSF